MENIVTVLGIVNTEGKITLLINDKTYKLNEEGMCNIDLNELFVSGEKGLFEYDRQLNNYIGLSQKIELYELFLGSNRFGITDTMSLLGAERILTRDVLMLGFKHKILRRIDTQWKLNMDKKDQLIHMLKVCIKQTGQQEDIPEPYKFEQTQKVENQMGIGPTPAVVIDKKRKSIR